MKRYDPEGYLNHQKQELSRVMAEALSLEQEIAALEISLPEDIKRAEKLKADNMCPIHNQSRYSCECSQMDSGIGRDFKKEKS